MNLMAVLEAGFVATALTLAGAPARLAAARAPLGALVPWLYGLGAAAGLLGALTVPAHPLLGPVRVAAVALVVTGALISARAARTGRRGMARLLLSALLILALGAPGLRHGGLAFAVNLVHLAGAAAWLGGLFWFAVWPGSPEERQRFSGTAAWGMALGLVSGLMATLLQREHGHAPNGTVLMVKHLLLLPVLGLGWWHHRGGGNGASLRVEAALGVAVLLAGAFLPLAPPGPVRPASGAEAGLSPPPVQPPDNLPGWPVTEAVPPTAGPVTAEPPPAGVYDAPLSEALQVAALARGYVLIQYNCDCPELVQAARHLLAEEPDRVILAPYPEMPARLALTAWARILVLDGWDGELVRKFIHVHRGRYQLPGS